VERGELRLPEMQRQYVWRSTRVRDLLDSIYRGYPSGTILLWETDEDVPQQKFAVQQSGNPYQSVRLLLDGQQRLTSLSAVIRGQAVTVQGRQRPSKRCAQTSVSISISESISKTWWRLQQGSRAF
jgi:hypothetical protein